jgi:hypothetical protein
MSHWMPRLTKTALLAGCAALMAASSWGQAPVTAEGPSDDSKVDIYGGYGWWNPAGNGVGGFEYAQLYNPNATASVAFYFTKYLGFQLEGGYFSKGRTLTAAGACTESPCLPVGERLYTAEGGPIVRFPLGRFIPFAHVLGGGEKLSGPQYNRLTWGWGVTGGVGLDYVLPFFNDLVAVRPIQADYEYQQVSYGPLQLPASNVGGFASFPSLKLSGGLVLRLGGRDMDHTPHGGLMLGCDASPSSVDAGDPVEVTANPMNLKPGRPKSYRWVSTGGLLKAGQDGASIATAGLAPGNYTVNGTLMQGRAVARCDATFTVKAVEPPSLSCSADPATVQAGAVTTITANAVSAANRRLIYSYTPDGGQITGTGSRVQLSTVGVKAQAINVVCNVVDDEGHTAQAGTMVQLLQTAGPSGGHGAVLPPPLAQTQPLCDVSFERDRRRPVRVDNEAKACLDDIALTMQRQTDARLEIVGDFSAGETPTEGAERALNVRQYLTDEKGVDVNRIEVRYGDNAGRAVVNVLVPAGVTYDNDQTTAFDPTTVKRVGQAYGKPGQHAMHRGHARHDAGRPVVRRRHHHKAGAQVAAPAGH